ncbi:hypothetical protein TRFO_28739 [Tritrichomonas foetus]|uniref:BEACH domain-containing protein n=1 Tax=Tritrichomonas foetus TaxID=1144522 RepID=A0A1J4JXL8_9EUKA|nr:hypothetical protein TRFO_28739 [Tritrichomonas foetus]|eukprot:OHT03897.1 hypothetical protein TRFO_28739 [Tritrichomonas foetus]
MLNNFFIGNTDLLESRNQYYNHFTKANIPAINNESILEIIKIINKDDFLIDELIPLLYSFQYDPLKLKEFIHMHDISDKNLDFISPVIFSNIFGFLFQYHNKACECDELMLIVNCLQKFSFTQHSEFSEIIFLIVMENCITIGSKSISIDMASLCCAFISNSHCYRLKSYNFLLLLLQKTYSCNYSQIYAPIWSLIQTLFDDTSDDSVICSVIMSRIHSFEPEVIETLQYISTKKNHSIEISKVYDNLPLLLSSISKTNIKPEIDNIFMDNNSNTTPFSIYEEIQHKSSNDDEIINNISMTDISFPDITVKIEMYLLDSLIAIYHQLLTLFSNIPPFYVESFLNSFHKLLENEFDGNFFISFVYFLTKIRNKISISQEMCNILFNHQIFNPEITIYFCTLHPLVHFLRQNIIKIIIIYNAPLISHIFQSFTSYPFLFVECLERIQILVDLFMDSSILFDERLFISLMTVENKLCEILSLVPQKSRSIVVSVRCKVFSFVFQIFQIFQIHSLPISLFQNPFFSTSFLSAFFEPIYKKVMFQQLKVILVSVNLQEKHPAIEFILHSLKIITQSHKKFELFEEFLFTLSECITLNPSIIPSSIEVFTTSIFLMENFTRETMMISLLKLGMNIMSYVPSFDFFPHEINQLARDFEQIECSELVQSSLLCLYASAGNVQASSVFLIQKPSITLLLASIYSSHNLTIQFFELMKQFANYSLFNLIQLHIGELDLLILEFIYNFPNDFTFHNLKFKNISEEKTIMTLLIPLLSKIGNSTSSIIVADGFVKLICPRNQGNSKFDLESNFPDKSCFLFPHFGGSYSELLNELLSHLSISKQNRRIFFSLALTQHKIIEKIDLHVYDMLQGLTIAFKISIDSKLAQILNIKCPIFTFQDQYGIFLRIFLKGTSLFLTQRSEELVSTFMLEEEMPNNISSAALSVEPINGNKMRIKFYLNSNYPISTIVSFDTVENTQIILKLGGGYEGENISEIEKLALYQLRTILMYDEPLKSKEWDMLNTSPDFSLETNKKLLFKLTDLGNVCILNNSIFEVFHYIYPIEKIIPVIAFFDTVDLRHRFLFIDFLVKMFDRKVLLNLNLLTYLISMNDPNILSLNFYTKLYTLIELSQNDIDQNLVFDSLLYNLELWCKSPNFHSILHFIQTTVFFSCTQQFLRPNFIQYTMSFGRNLPKLIDSQDRINDYRLKLSMIIKDRILIMIYSHDITTMLLSLIYCPEKSMCHTILSILPAMLERTYPNENPYFIYLFLNFQYFYIPEFLEEILKCMRELQNIKYFIGYFQYYLPLTLSNTELMINELVYTPKLLNIVLLAGIKTRNNVLQQKLAGIVYSFAQNTNAKKQIITDEFWMVWPLLFAANIEYQSQVHICYFIVQIIKDNFNSDTLDIILDILDLYEIDNLKPLIMKLIIDQYLLVFPKTNLEHILIRCFRVLFISSFEHNIDLIKSMKQSPFNIDIHIPKKIYIDSILAAKLKLDKCEVIFHLKHNKYMNPIEKELMTITQRSLDIVISKSPNENNAFLNYICAIISISDNQNPSNFNPKFIENVIGDSFNLLMKDYIDSIQEHLNDTIFHLNHFFSINDSVKRCVLNAKKESKDPLPTYLKINRVNQQNAIKDIMKITREHMHDQSIWKMDDYIWKRNTRVTSRFASIQMTRCLFNSFPKNKYCAPDVPSSIYNCECTRVKLNKLQHCRFYILPTKLVIIYPYKIQEILSNDVRHILIKKRYQISSGLEIYTTDGYSYLFDFYTRTSEFIISKLRSTSFSNIELFQQTSSFSDFFKETSLIKSYANGLLSNYEFLSFVNAITGRSFNDSTIYPIFPTMTSDRQGGLILPADSLTSDRLSKLNECYKITETFFHAAPSNCFLVAYYSIRIQPFTQLSMRLNDGKFDVHERMFNSYETFLRIRADNVECKEVIPEFYSFPEIFMRLNTQCCDLKDLKIPNQYHSIFDFVYKHRKQLDIEFNVSQWFDLIFGADQNNSHIFNVFDKCLYENAWKDFSEEPETFIHDKIESLGSIPPKIFNGKCPNKIFKQGNYLPPQRFKHRMNKKFKYAISVQNSHVTFIIALLIDNSVAIFDIQQSNNIKTIESLSLENHVMTKTNESICFFQRYGKYITFVDHKGISNKMFDSQMTDIDNHTNSKTTGRHTIDIAVFDENLLAIASYDGILTIYNENIRILATFLVSWGKICTLTLSKEYDVVVVGTRDSVISIFSIHKKRYLKSYKMDEIPFKILITKSKGLILAFSFQNITILTINGFFVKSFHIDIKIDQVCHRGDPNSGSDMVYFSDFTGHLFVFDSFEPEKYTCIAACGNKVISLLYHDCSSSLIAITDVGTSIIINN